MNNQDYHIISQGDTLGIIAPSGSIRNRELFEQGIRLLHELGFKTKFPRDLWPSNNYIAGEDEQRGYEFNTMWADSDIDAIMAARGGYGVLRMLEHIDIDLINHTPKHLIGFSDITLLHCYLSSETTLSSLHGPVVTSLPQSSNCSINSFAEMLHGKKEVELPRELEIINDNGSFEGLIYGGNLTSLTSILGTEFDCSWKDKIIILEDVAEPLYKIDRMLTQLYYSGKMSDACAIIIGDMSSGLGLNETDRRRHQESVWRRVIDLVPSSISVWANFPIGHGSINHSIPLGRSALFDPSSCKILFTD